MSSLLSLLKIELCSAEDNLMSMLDKVLDKLLEVQCTWTSIHESHVVHREA